MLFNSMAFMVFLPIVFIIYWLLPHKYRWILLLLSSYYFYMSWNAKYVILIFLTTGVSYVAALLLDGEKNSIKRKGILLASALFCLGILFFFKYFNFLSESVTSVLNHFAIPASPVMLKVMLPVGISFYTFQTLGYVIDVYRGNVKAERHFGIYATFISFFPQLVAGPIERTDNLLPQIKKRHIFNYESAVYGMKLMIWGYFKKMAIADNLAQYVDMVFSEPSAYHWLDLLIAVFFFTIQIYCDFSGYSDIAIGTARLFGIDLMTNFRSPYFSTSLQEFWSRWHISLSTWFRDYVYIPLGGNRCSKMRRSFNLLVTFLVSGLWHGANWTFLFWGGIHGGMQVIENLFTKWIDPMRERRIGKLFTGMLVFLFCSMAWIFFRAETLTDAFYIVGHIFSGMMNPLNNLTIALVISKINVLVISVMLSVLASYDFLNYKTDIIEKISRKSIIFQWIFYIAIGLMVVFCSRKGVPTEFVYFQF